MSKSNKKENLEKISKNELIKANNKEYKINYKPKPYHSSFLNTVNKDARSSRPETVGRLATDLFPKYWQSFFPGNLLAKQLLCMDF